MDKDAVLVLCYHKVNTLKVDTNLLAVSIGNFYQHMAYLKRNYTILRFDEDWSELEGRGIVVTFDDGYLDNYTNALPILEELDIPATIFVCTGSMKRNRELWWDELENLLLVGSGFPDKFHLADEEYEYTWQTNNHEMRLNCYASLHHLMKDFISVERRENWLRQLWQWRQRLPEVRSDNLVITESICQELSKSRLINIGAHTVMHPSLNGISLVEQRDEIKGSIDCLEKVLSKKIDIFSYPFGAYGRDFTEETIEICRGLGIKKAAAADMGIWQKHMDDYSIPRNGVRNMDLFDFESMINKIWEMQG